MLLAFDSQLLIQRIAEGLANGAIYALLALSLVVVFRSTGQLNFAQGEMALVSAYVASTLTLSGTPVWVGVLGGAIVGFCIGAATERFLIRPAERTSPFAGFLIAIALLFGLNALVQMFWGVDARGLPSIFPNDSDDFIRIGGAPVRIERLGIMATLLVLGLLLWLLFNKTKVGLAMRAVASNPESARLVGIRVGSILVLGWGLAAFVGGIAGGLVAPGAGLSTALMFGIFIYAAAAATLGGLDSPLGAIVGGLFMGLFASLVTGYVKPIGGDLILTVTLALILLVLLFRPAGLFGSSKVERV